MKLNSRDLAALYCCHQNRFLALRHFHRKLWPEASIQAATHRIALIRAAGHLKRCELPAQTLRRLKASYPEHTVYFICRSAERAVTFREWCLDLRTWDDRPEQVRIAYFDKASRAGAKDALRRFG